MYLHNSQWLSPFKAAPAALDIFFPSAILIGEKIHFKFSVHVQNNPCHEQQTCLSSKQNDS